jgi:aminoglycoside 6'-N-acetyltransferase I
MPDRLQIRPVVPSDAEVWRRLRCKLWPDGNNDHGLEIANFFAGLLREPLAVFLAFDAANKTAGLVELSIRTDVPSLEGKRTAFIEGLYVVPEMRFCGVARRLLNTSRDWSRSMHCVAFASDRSGRYIVDRQYQKRRR